MGEIKRVFVEKKDAFAVEAKGLLQDLRENLRLDGLKQVRILARYDCMGLTEEEFAEARRLVLSEPPVDTVSDTLETAPDERAFALELLPGQYDQREDFAEQCIQLLSQNKKPVIAAAKVFVLKGSLTDEQFATVKHYLINPIEAREAAMENRKPWKTRGRSRPTWPAWKVSWIWIGTPSRPCGSSWAWP